MDCLAFPDGAPIVIEWLSQKFYNMVAGHSDLLPSWKTQCHAVKGKQHTNFVYVYKGI